tara:strand:+ start:750 stop:1100 length:351 start_codon:yes stop_codon:yes gene_type:complete
MIFTKIEQKFERARIDRAERCAMIRGLRRTRAILVCSGVFGIIGGLAFGVIVGASGFPPKLLEIFNEIVPILVPISIGLLFWGILAHQDIKMLILTGDRSQAASDRLAEQVVDPNA